MGLAYVLFLFLFLGVSNDGRSDRSTYDFAPYSDKTTLFDGHSWYSPAFNRFLVRALQRRYVLFHNQPAREYVLNKDDNRYRCLNLGR